jgi:hypothetical protein
MREQSDPAAGADSAAPERKTLKNAGIAAAVLLAPGGFILGGVLIARALKKRRDAQAAAEKQEV